MKNWAMMLGWCRLHDYSQCFCWLKSWGIIDSSFQVYPNTTSMGDIKFLKVTNVANVV